MINEFYDEKRMAMNDAHAPQKVGRDVPDVNVKNYQK
jgi:hypothetical protein